MNIDGRTAATPPGGVPTLAIWAGRGTAGREITGAENVTIPNQTHVQVATSAESFAPMYRFFTGHRPRAGHRAGAPDHPLRARPALPPEHRCRRPHARGLGGLRPDRPAQAAPPVARARHRRRRFVGTRARDPCSGAHYEFALSQGGSEHPPPLLRAVRAQQPPGAAAHLRAQRRRQPPDRAEPGHSAFTIVRYKELWGDQGAENDELSVNGTNVINAATAPITKRVIGMFAFDAGSDNVSNVTRRRSRRLRAAVPERRRPLRPGDGSRRGDKLGGAPVTWRWAVAGRQRPRLPFQHRLDLGEPERLRPFAPAPPPVALATARSTPAKRRARPEPALRGARIPAGMGGG